MRHPILLISADEGLAGRVRQALPAGIAIELQCAASYQAAPEGREWLLVMVDEAAVRGGEGEADAARRYGGEVVWLGQAGRAEAWEGRGRVVDAVGRDACVSKLALVLRQHFASAYLRRMRSRPLGEERVESGEAPVGRRREFNNALTGLMGNAELALQGSGRLPQGLRQRLQRICELAGRLRDLTGPGLGEAGANSAEGSE